MCIGNVIQENVIAIIKLMEAAEAKSKGLKYVQKSKYRTALKYFDKLVFCLEDNFGFNEELEPKRKTLLASGYLHSAICLLKLERYSAAVDACDNALILKPRDGETLFYLAQGCMKLGGYEEAVYIFRIAYKINPQNEDCVDYIQQCHHEMLYHPEDEEEW